MPSCLTTPHTLDMRSGRISPDSKSRSSRHERVVSPIGQNSDLALTVCVFAHQVAQPYDNVDDPLYEQRKHMTRDQVRVQKVHASRTLYPLPCQSLAETMPLAVARPYSKSHKYEEFKDYTQGQVNGILAGERSKWLPNANWRA